LFVPGYRDDRPPAVERGIGAPRPGGQPADGQYADGQYSGSQYGWGGSAPGKGPVRGFPPAPGQPPPLYPPGQFSAWNRTSEQEAGPPAGDLWPAESWAGDQHQEPARAEPGSTEPGSAIPGPAGHAGYSVLAVSDPAADVTSTQTWGAVGDGQETGAWADPRAPGDARQAPGASTQTPPRGSPVRADDASGQDVVTGPGTGPGRVRGHGTGARGVRAAPRARWKMSRGLLAASLAVLVAIVGGAYVLLGGSHGG